MTEVQLPLGRHRTSCALRGQAPADAKCDCGVEPDATLPRKRKEPTRYLIQTTAPRRTCKCKASFWWGLNEYKTRIPISIDWDGCRAPTRNRAGIGINHFITCPLRKQYKKPGESTDGAAKP